MVIDKNFSFIDLFAGIGGFHCAMKKYSPESRCIMASEINKDARKVYEDNYGMEPMGDITKIDPKALGKYDVICGGFPCQTFSKAGSQQGFKDPRGTLFQEIIRFAEAQENIEDRPKILLLENVGNLKSHDKGDTWKTIHHELSKAGYNVIDMPIIIGPIDLGIPQIRERAVIVAVRSDIYDGPIKIDIERKERHSTSIYSIVDKNISEEELAKCALTDHQIKLINCWDDFYRGIKETVLGNPVWSDEFGLDYDLSIYPEWKQKYVQWNRNLYDNNKEFIDQWYKKWKIKEWTTATERKFEWQCSSFISSAWEGILQFRTSGLRVKRPTESPTLVTMDHRPILGMEKRFMSIKEIARLQSFPDDFVFNEDDRKAMRQLGNAVNVDVIEYVFRRFIDYLEEVTHG